MMTLPIALTIAGTDPSGGAGIQADLKTFQELDVFGTSAITAVVSQNTLGVRSFVNMETSFIEDQLKAVFEDLPPHAVKTGMLSAVPVIEVTAHVLKTEQVKNYVMDPVMVAKSGDALLAEDARSSLLNELLPLATVVTPNIPEAEEMVGQSITTIEHMKDAAKKLVEVYGATACVLKGGHRMDDEQATDILYTNGAFDSFSSPRVATKHTHGTGCTYSAAITAALAKGASIPEAVQTAKAFISAAIEDSLNIGHGNGPTNHWAWRRRQNK
ncbi:bifunctional hydroxymethylpyrimidine kinase/phosphomethylpyrimidine kinase [Bacillaceae bacterium SIJ1]|uniref:bifunctional hydroxymethylpyrimidine kinase/phosphomethylpyrimidine kinase n=1 Tax=Litoribacterium kuwaitense TaxID=1398745 RepID=UPI0013EA3F94|nr:bifunctional hydroxymethylpyrimidine kinase/phosphomethylpyrimidine kinase [Litoribacterium kuwaitense]NGP45913.1 bifunctional hydroxymethylpyrimidine kinase/phosphomethylpyrimidine kinase [Litoribacterium kuwaitense]